MRCIACDNKDSEFFMKKDGHDLYKCANCGLMFVFPLPEDSLGIYSEDYFCGARGGFGYADYDADKKPMLSSWIKYMDRIEKFLPDKGAILDVGTATGYFMKIAKGRGWQPTGVEVSDYAAQRGREYNLDIITGTLEDIHGEEKFDSITMWDLVEHLKDPEQFFFNASRLLKKGGIVGINTPDASSVPAKILGKRWHLIVPPEHLHYFNSQSLSLLLRKTGFEVLESSRIGKTFTLYYIIRFIENRLNLPKFFGNQIAKSALLSRIAIPINTHDNIFMLAKKI